MIGKEEKKNTMFLSKISIYSCYDHTLHCGGKHFHHYCLAAFRTAGKLKCHIKDSFKINGKKNNYFKINGKKTIKMSQKGKYIKFKNFRRKIKSPFMIEADFESILVSEDNGKQNPNKSSTNKYQKHVACSCYGHKLICNYDKFSKPLKSYLGEDAVYNLLAVMIKESKYCSDVMKTNFNKELVMTKENN